MPDIEQVVCLVRAADISEGMARIRSIMPLYKLWEDAFSPRERPVAGDLSQEYFGLGASHFMELSRSSDVVFYTDSACILYIAASVDLLPRPMLICLAMFTNRLTAGSGCILHRKIQQDTRLLSSEYSVE
ncbi:hypothetical protein EDD21DRAFT_178330 [Dissophora ornata]|nr:hypothetical protein EDD21DRAFT_178330 [Dissophora ornata]